MTETAVVAQITNGGDFARRNGFPVSLKRNGLQTTGVVHCDQIRTLDLLKLKSWRLLRKTPLMKLWK
ncbi:type II toxin-antitoxin system PemK/MazF family toxin [Parasutterella secunda]|uniref:type II toxin-antitoxin system PemK/MazF family toxin n=1 Tax=Parasutterella secunda TaxID=626947 RepID=UPI0025A49538|nr:type II toxin-antitoxin system PemK/MazF family toxin [Parasutterella secunda]MDM8217429.1 type II toxin-antitoxin system PemK/MazF family toxin [Parasutterella secunda]